MELPAENPLAGQLAPDERILWSGRPKAGILFRPDDLYLIPISIVWAALTFVAVASILASPRKLPNALAIPVPCLLFAFVIAAVYVTFGRFVSEARKRSKTFYAVSNRRVLVQSGQFGELRSLDLAALGEIECAKKADGSGTIFFGPTRYSAGFSPMSSWSRFRRGGCPPFEAVANVDEAAAIIRAAQSAV